MGFPRMERWKTVSDNEIASLEKHGVSKPIPIPSGEAITSSKKHYTEDAIQRYGIFLFFFFSFIALIADGPHHYHPACGYKGSSHLFPVHALQFVIAMQVQHSYNSSTNG